MKEEQIQRVLDLARSADSAKTIEELGNVLVDKMASLFEAKKVSLMLLDKEDKELSIWASSDKEQDLKNVKVPYGSMFAGWVAKEGEPLLVKDVETEFPDCSKDRLGKYSTKSFVISPIKSADKVYGVANITERFDSGAFGEDDLEIAGIINPFVTMQMKKVRLSEQIEKLVAVDSITGLFNHRYFQEQLSEEIGRARRYHRSLSLIIADIDNFQEFNKNCGYAMGDKAIAQLAGIFKDNLRKVDIIARYSGERFAVILPDTGRKQVAVAAEKLRDKIESAVFVEKRTSALLMDKLTVSIGAAEYDIKHNKEEFISIVTQAMQEAKQKGKNCVCVHK